MVVNLVVFEVRGGAVLAELEAAELSWSVQSNTAETVEASFRLTGASDWRNLLTEWKHGVAVDVGGGRLLGGPIMPHQFTDDTGMLRVTARGLRVAFDRRSILPLAALTSPLVTGGVPDTALDTVLTDLDLGSIARAVGVQACTWPGWVDVPIVWGSARAGTRERTYVALDRKSVDSAWADLSGVENGPDIRLRLTRDGEDAIQWVFESGTEDVPRLQSDAVFPFEPAQGSGLTVTTNPARMGSVAWSEGGRSSDTALVRMSYDPFLVDAGFPLLEMESAASPNTVDASTLDAWNTETLRTARRPWEFWTFKVRSDRSPFPWEYNCGDLVDVYVTEEASVSGGYVAARREPYRRRIVGLSGDIRDDWVTVTCGEVYDG